MIYILSFDSFLNLYIDSNRNIFENMFLFVGFIFFSSDG